MRHFYGSELELNVTWVDDTSSVRVGHSFLNFELEQEVTGTYHVAFNVPGSRFEEARAWLETRAPLLHDAHGHTSFVFDSWQSQAVYVLDPDGNLIELIGRRALDPITRGAFGASHLLGISEVGVVVDDVPAVVQGAERHLGVTPYLGQRHPEFTAVGDETGLLIVVKTGRPWFPTLEPALSPPVHVSFDQASVGLLVHGGSAQWRTEHAEGSS